jgi:tetratricopeptide (TPR) repeat protein
VFNVRWSEAAGSPRLDPPPHHLENLGWSGRADWVIRRFDEHAETLDASRSQRLRQGLWALNLTTGDDIPLTLEAGDYRMPRLSGRQGWLLYLEVTEDGGAGNPPRGALWARPIEASAGGLRHAERLHLRASPLIDAGRYEEALPYLRDALRLNPGLNDARLALAEAGMAMAETTEGSAAAGLLLAHAVRELTLLAAGSPTTPLYRRELTRAFLGYAVVAGRIQAAAAADRGRAFLEGDPDRQASPEQVRSVLQPDLIDAILWDPAPEDGWRLLESALDYYRGP